MANKAKNYNTAKRFDAEMLAKKFNAIRQSVDSPDFLGRLQIGDDDAYLAAVMVLEPYVRGVIGRRRNKEEHAKNYIKQVFGDGGCHLHDWCTDSSNRGRFFKDFVAARVGAIADQRTQEVQSIESALATSEFRAALDKVLRAYEVGGAGNRDLNAKIIRYSLLGGPEPNPPPDPTQHNRADDLLYKYLRKRQGDSGVNIRTEVGISSGEWNLCLMVFEGKISLRTRSDRHIYQNY